MSRRPNFSMEQQADFIKSLIEHYGETIVTSKQILDFAESRKLDIPYFVLRNESMKIGRGKYQLGKKNGNGKKSATFATRAAAPAPESVAVEVPEMIAKVVQIASKRAINVTESFVPAKMKTYVPFGFYRDLKNIINSKIFYPVFITGLSGNGKTLMVEQVCADLGRELVRVNITKLTDESDLIGSYELIDGSTVRREGPVLTAMRRGAVLLLDEVDLGTETLLCLQPILEGKAYFDKKTGEVITPAYGFEIVATANTKGKGSDDGRFIGTQILNEAFLERFAVTVEQDYPESKIERKILDKNFEMLGVSDDTFAEHLVVWADVIRKSFNDGAVDEVVSTRRLVHVAKAYSIFKDRMKALELCLNRFDGETKTSFLDLYTKVDASANAAEVAATANTATSEATSDEKLAFIVATLSAKYNTPVKIHRNDNINYIVESHNRKTCLDVSIVTSANYPLEIFDSTVANHQFLTT